MIDTVVDKAMAVLTYVPRSINAIRYDMPSSPRTNKPFAAVPVRKALADKIAEGKCDRVMGISDAGQECWLYFRCEKVATVPDIDPEITLYQTVMSKVWDRDIFV